MNASQSNRYGFIRTGIVSPITRAAWCPWCDFTVRMRRRGSALATASKLRGEVMAHIRATHPDVLADVVPVPEPTAAELAAAPDCPGPRCPCVACDLKRKLAPATAPSTLDDPMSTAGHRGGADCPCNYCTSRRTLGARLLGAFKQS